MNAVEGKGKGPKLLTTRVSHEDLIMIGCSSRDRRWMQDRGKCHPHKDLTKRSPALTTNKFFFCDVEDVPALQFRRVEAPSLDVVNEPFPGVVDVTQPLWKPRQLTVAQKR